MNVRWVNTTATLMPTAPTQRDLSTAHAIRDTLGMESLVLVSIILPVGFSLASFRCSDKENYTCREISC